MTTKTCSVTELIKGVFIYRMLKQQVTVMSLFGELRFKIKIMGSDSTVFAPVIKCLNDIRLAAFFKEAIVANI